MFFLIPLLKISKVMGAHPSSWGKEQQTQSLKAKQLIFYISSCYICLGKRMMYIWMMRKSCFFFSQFFKKFLLILIAVQLLYNVCQLLLHGKMNQPYIYIYPFLFGLASHSGHHSALSRVPCAIWQVIISYPFYTQYQQCKYVHPNLPIPSTLPVSPLTFHFFWFVFLSFIL